MSNLKEQGKKAFIWDFSGKMATHGMGFVVSIFLARLLEPSDFGLIAIVMVIIGGASVFTDIGLGGALIQRRKVNSTHYSSVFYLNIVIGLLLAFITYISAAWISNFYNSEQLLPLVEVMSFLFLINAFSSVQSTRLRKELNYALLTKISFVSSLLSGIVGVLLAFSGAGVWSLVAQTLAMAVMYNILIWNTSKWKPSLAFSWKALKQLWGFGFRMFLAGMLDAIFTKLDFLIIGKLFPPATLGYFQRAKSLNNMVAQYSSESLMAVLFPILSKVQNDLPRFQNIILKSLGIISFIVFLLLGGLYLVSEELIVLLFSDKWLASVDIFKVLVLSGFGYPINALLVNVLASRGNSKLFLRLEICKKLIVSVNLLVLYFLGINIFLYGLVVKSFLGVSLNVLFASREIKLPFYVFAKPIIVQMTITIIAVVITMLFTKEMALYGVAIPILKGSLFAFLYVSMNHLINTSSYECFLDQMMPVVKMKFRNIKG